MRYRWIVTAGVSGVTVLPSRRASPSADRLSYAPVGRPAGRSARTIVPTRVGPSVSRTMCTCWLSRAVTTSARVADESSTLGCRIITSAAASPVRTLVTGPGYERSAIGHDAHQERGQVARCREGRMHVLAIQDLSPYLRSSTFSDTETDAAAPFRPRRGQDLGVRVTDTGTATSESAHQSPWRRESANLMLALATVGFAVNFWAWALLSPLGPELQGRLALDRLSAGPVGRRPGCCRCAWSDPGRRSDRPVRRSGDVPDRVLRDDRAGAVPWSGRPFEPWPSALRWVLPRHRGHGLRGWRSLRQRVVPAGAPRIRGRRLRRWDGWHGDQRADNGEAGQGSWDGNAVRDHRGGTRGVRRVGGVGLARRPRASGPDGEVRRPADLDATSADHLAGLGSVRGWLRWLRRVQRLPADVPQECLLAGADRCGEQDGRLRRCSP